MIKFLFILFLNTLIASKSDKLNISTENIGDAQAQSEYINKEIELQIHHIANKFGKKNLYEMKIVRKNIPIKISSKIGEQKEILNMRDFEKILNFISENKAFFPDDYEIDKNISEILKQLKRNENQTEQLKLFINKILTTNDNQRTFFHITIPSEIDLDDKCSIITGVHLQALVIQIKYSQEIHKFMLYNKETDEHSISNIRKMVQPTYLLQFLSSILLILCEDRSALNYPRLEQIDKIKMSNYNLTKENEELIEQIKSLIIAHNLDISFYAKNLSIDNKIEHITMHAKNLHDLRQYNILTFKYGSKFFIAMQYILYFAIGCYILNDLYTYLSQYLVSSSSSINPLLEDMDIGFDD